PNSPVKTRAGRQTVTPSKRQRASIGKWTQEEDQILAEQVQKYGAKNWREISHA
ncbi:unnamed protein product, partial [Heterosigma akashiwo]